MAYQAHNEWKMTHKNGKSRGTLKRTRLTQNGQKVDLRKLAARRTLKVRQ